MSTQQVTRTCSRPEPGPRASQVSGHVPAVPVPLLPAGHGVPRSVHLPQAPGTEGTAGSQTGATPVSWGSQPPRQEQGRSQGKTQNGQRREAVIGARGLPRAGAPGGTSLRSGS